MSDKRYTVTQEQIVNIREAAYIAGRLNDNLKSFDFSTLAPEPSADVMERIEAIMQAELEKVKSADGKSVWDEIMDNEVPLAVPRALASLIESEVDRRIKEREDGNN